MTQEKQDIENASSALHHGEKTSHSNHVERSPYVGFWVRVAASVIDNVIIGILSLPVGFIFGFASAFIDNRTLGMVFYVMGQLFSFGLVFVYYIFLTHKYQATLGKMAVGAKVVRDDGQRLTLGKIILRETIGKIVSSLVLMIGYLMVAFTSKKQGLHDMMAHSVVIYKDPVKRARGWVVGVVLGLYALIIITIIAIFAFLASIGMSAASGGGFLDVNNGNIRGEYYDDAPYDNYDTDFYDAETGAYYDPIEEYVGNELPDRVRDSSMPETEEN